MTTGMWVLLAAVVLAVGFGSYRALTDGHFRGTHRVRGATSPPTRTDDGVWPRVAGAFPSAALGERATLVQFSSAFCAPCRTTRRVLAGIAESEPGVVHVEIDAELHLEIVRHLGILRTPTTLLLGPAGQELGRAGGVPSRDQVLRVLSGC
ncbi:thioredoxin family protein [Nocardioides sp.]|uniref:thioredoxin family protein n=1 Tax=Nocardioides sp. TaxID=35761 RepID=UPI0031FE9F34|nr:putative thioredoxin [Nocardioides sp.]